MSDKDLARRTQVEITFGGVDITDDIAKVMTSIDYTDNEENEADDLQIKIEDRDFLWLKSYLNKTLDAAAGPSVEEPAASASGDWVVGEAVTVSGRPQYSSYGEGKPGGEVTDYSGKITHLNLKSGVSYPIHVDYLGWFSISQVTKVNAPKETSGKEGLASKGLKIHAKYIRQNWDGDGKDLVLDCGDFELDNVKISGPPNVIIFKASSMPFGSIRQTNKSKAWEKYKLSAIAKEIAGNAKMKCLYSASGDPLYDRKEQSKESDISFLSDLCKDAGVSLKITDNTMVLFDQSEYEKKDPICTIERGVYPYIKYNLGTGKADVQYASCQVSYTNPATGKVLSGTAYADDYDEEDEDNLCLEVEAKVSTVAEAKTLAAKRLRLHNKFEHSVSFTFYLRPEMVTGCTVLLRKWGPFDGKYIISQSKHSVGRSGSTTTAKLRKVLNY